MRLTRLEIELLPGVRGPFTLDFGGGVDLVVGPNTSGKSSLVRAVLGLLWPDGPGLDEHWLRAEFSTASGTLVAERRPGAGLRWLRDGVAVPAPDLPGGHLADCYRLGLRDLTSAGETSLEQILAAEIRKQMAGGFDLDLDPAGLIGLGPREAARRRDDLRQANQAAETIRQQYGELERRRRQQVELEAELQAARDAALQATRLEQAADRVGAARDRDAAAAALTRFPTVLERLTPQDPATLRDLLSSRERLTDDLAADGRRLEQAEAELAALRIPAAAAAAERTAALEVAIAAWRETAARLATAAAEAEGGRRALALARGRLPDGAPETAAPDRTAVARLAELSLRRQGETAREEAAREAAAALDLTADGAGPGPGLVLAGIGAIVVLAAALAVPSPVLRAALAAAGLLLLGAGGRLAAGRLAERGLIARWRRHLETLGSQAAAQRTGTEREREALLRDSGLGRGLEDIQVLHDLEAAAAVAEALRHAADADGRLAERERRHGAAARQFGELAAELGLPVAADAEAAEAVGRAWNERLQRAQDLSGQLAEGRRRRERDAAELQRTEDKLTALCDRLGLDAAASQPTDLDALAADLAPWRRQRELLSNAEDHLARCDAAVTPELRALDGETLAQRLAAARDAAARSEELQEQLHGLRRDLDAARGSHSLEAAFGRRDDARDALAEVRDRDRRTALTGWLLEDLRAADDTATRPPVLTRAAELFARFTRQRYALRVTAPAGGLPEFLAHDGVHDRDLGLAQLSDGTRTQLLLAVRLAFLLQVEDEIHPPWFLDEALTTSDPERFAATAAALAEVAAEHGRQLIYLTSQAVDAGAWRGALQAAGLAEPGVLDLARIRNLAGAAPAAALAGGGPPPPPSAAGLDTAGYGRRLGIGTLDPWLPDGAQPLFWLLRDDLELLEELLTAGVTTVGIWKRSREMLERTGVVPVARAGGLDARAKLLAAFGAAWRRGRGRPVTPDLVQGLSETMTARVLEALPELGWDAAALAAAVADRKIARFTTAKAAPLLDHLRAAGCLDDRPVLDLDGVMREVVDAFESLPGERRPSLAEVRGLVAGWWAAAAAERDGATRPSS